MHSHTQLEFIVEAVPALIGYVDPDERYRFNNLVYQDWFGTAPWRSSSAAPSATSSVTWRTRPSHRTCAPRSPAVSSPSRVS